MWGLRNIWRAKNRGLVVLGLGLVLLAGCGQTGLNEDTAPTRNEGAVWQIGYYQGGDYFDYAENLKALAISLADLGWIEPIDFPQFDDPEDTEAVWRFLSAKVKSEYLEFSADAYWSAEWDDDLRLVVRSAALETLSTPGQVDLVIAMGTWAGQDLVNNEHNVPTMALSSSDPIAAGIISTFEDSGFDHVMVEVDPERYRRQIRLYHDLLGFKNLGVVYEDSPDGRIYANLPDLELVAAERNFNLVRCHAEENYIDPSASQDLVQACYQEILPQIDAVWIGLHTGESIQFMPQSLALLLENDTPTMSPTGPDAVRRGVLISLAYTNFEAAGDWYAESLARILNGESPRGLDQVFELPAKIVINLETAHQIGFDVPPGLLSAADEIFETIEGEE